MHLIRHTSRAKNAGELLARECFAEELRNDKLFYILKKEMK